MEIGEMERKRKRVSETGDRGVDIYSTIRRDGIQPPAFSLSTPRLHSQACWRRDLEGK